MVRLGVPGQNIDSLAYADGRLSTVPVVQSVRRPTVTDKKYPIWCEWRTNKDASSPVEEGEFWKLIRFESNGDATWVRYQEGEEADREIGAVANLGIFKSGNTTTIKAADNTDLSATNPGYVTLFSNVNSGQKVTVAVTANQSFEDSGGTDDLSGFTFGIGATDNWGTNDLPFYIIAVLKNDDSEVAFALTRDPGRFNSAASGQTAHLGGGTCSQQGGFFYTKDLTAGGDAVANWAGMSCRCIGGLRLRTTNGSSAWVVQAPTGTSAGIGNFMEPYQFVFPAGVMGAAASSFFHANGGTAPVFTTLTSYNYAVTRYGVCIANVFMSGDGGTDGVGAVNVRLATPYVSAVAWDLGVLRLVNPTVTSTFAMATNINAQSYCNLTQSAGTLSQNGDWTNGSRTVSGVITIHMKSA